MPVRNYSVLKGRPIEGAVFQPKNPQRDQPHYHIHIKNEDGSEFDIAVNILSDDGSEVLFIVKDNFAPKDADSLNGLSIGITPLRLGNPDALDYVKQNLVTKDQMSDVPASNTTDTPLSQIVDGLIQAAITDENGLVYAWGSVFGDQGASPFWGFTPDSGIHDIHMNQGNPPGHHDSDNGAAQDGGLAVFANGAFKTLLIAFQTQSFSTDEDGNVVGAPEPVANPQGSHGQNTGHWHHHHGGRNPR
jgi:uncharacterized protein YukJ